jgi:hypothetical protein
MTPQQHRRARRRAKYRTKAEGIRKQAIKALRRAISELEDSGVYCDVSILHFELHNWMALQPSDFGNEGNPCDA